MLVTVNTDASFNKKHMVGSYAFWIICDDFRLQASGELRKTCHRPEEAEFKCIINALTALFLQPSAWKIHFVIINTDCLNVIHCLKNDKASIKRYNLEHLHKTLTPKYQKVIKEWGRVKFEFRHVKAHRDTSTPRTFVNDWCDKEAKRHINVRIEKEKNKKPQAA